MYNFFDGFFFGLDGKKKNPLFTKKWNGLNIFYRLLELYLGRFTYELDENTDARYLEMCLLYNNMAAFAEVNGKVQNFGVIAQSYYNQYGYPNKYQLHDYMGKNYGTFIPDLPGNEDFADSVFAMASKINVPPIVRIKWYAERLTEIETAISAGIGNTKASVVIQCSKEQQSAVKKAWEMAGNGAPFILYFNDMEGAYQDKPLVQSNGAISDALITLNELRDKTFANFLEEFGLNSSAVINKLSGVSEKELNQNNESISLKLNLDFNIRKDLIDRCNKRYGKNYSVKISFDSFNSDDEYEEDVEDVSDYDI